VWVQHAGPPSVLAAHQKSAHPDPTAEVRVARALGAPLAALPCGAAVSGSRPEAERVPRAQVAASEPRAGGGFNLWCRDVRCLRRGRNRGRGHRHLGRRGVGHQGVKLRVGHHAHFCHGKRLFGRGGLQPRSHQRPKENQPMDRPGDNEALAHLHARSLSVRVERWPARVRHQPQIAETARVKGAHDLHHLRIWHDAIGAQKHLVGGSLSGNGL